MVNIISKIVNVYYFVLMMSIVILILIMIIFNKDGSLYLNTITIDPEAYIDPSNFKYRFITLYGNIELIGICFWMLLTVVPLFFMILSLSSIMFSFDYYAYSLETKDMLIPVALLIFGIMLTCIIENKVSSKPGKESSE